jgi:hypothetical protein
VKLLGLLGSDHAGERENAGRLAHEHIRRLKLTWDQVIAPSLLPAPRAELSWQEMCAAVLASGEATAWEQSFCTKLLSWRGNLSDKQKQILQEIFEKCSK